MFYLDPPIRLDAQPFTSLPDEWAVPGTSAAAGANEWANNILAGKAVNSFLEGPCFDSAGNLYVVDIPFGRIFRITPDGSWSLFASYDGWPNGLKVTSDGRILVADHRQGLVEITETGKAVVLVSGYRGERFRGRGIQRVNMQMIGNLSHLCLTILTLRVLDRSILQNSKYVSRPFTVPS